MILEIRLSNFFSIKDEIVLNLRAGNSRTKKSDDLKRNVFEYKGEEILKTIALYGANASGKSNIIKAIRFCCRMVIQSHLHNENTVFNFMPFKFENYKEKPSTFLIIFVSNNIKYEYSFSLNRLQIFTESLYYYPHGRRALIFSRDEMIVGTKGEKYSFGSLIKRPLDVAESTSLKSLYISRASQMDRDLGKEIFSFFNGKFILGDAGYYTEPLETIINNNKKIFLKALQIADSDIIDIKVRKENVPTKNLKASLTDNTASITDEVKEIIKITSYHKSAPSIPFDFEKEESEGTKNLFLLLTVLLDVIKDNSIILIDEIESSMHTTIVEFIIKLFNVGNSAQLIFSTHNTRLLDLDKFRKDQIYFVNKKPDSSTDLYSLFDYKDFRDTMDVEKAYLQGRFDAVPFIDDSISNLKTLVNGKA